LNDPEDGDNAVQAKPGEIVVLHLEHVVDFKKRCPEIFDTIVECSAFVNYRQIQSEVAPVLALSFYENSEWVDQREGRKF